MTRVRPWLPFAAIGVLVLLAAALAGPPAGEGQPLDPRSPGRRGTKALVEVLGRLGARVTITRAAPAAADRTALVLADALNGPTRERLRAWTADGGTLVLADPFSRLNPFPLHGLGSIAVTGSDLERRCALPALRQVRRVAISANVLLDAPAPATGCFPRGGGYWMVTRPVGRGEVVVLSGARPFTNDHLDEADNGMLAVALLAGRPGGRVAVLQPPAPGGGQRSLVDLIAPPVKLALAQLGVAFAVLALWRGRRLGRPVLEPQPVQVPGSELVLAVGRLMQRGRRRGKAASVLREDLRRSLAERLGLPAGSPPEAVADAVAARTALPSSRVGEALSGPEPAGESDLVGLAQLVESVRQEVARVP